jgi:post-segregation antitoxin (ccd killing protein)
MPTSEAQKKANKKWRENNKEYIRDITRLYAKKYYYNNRDLILEKRKLKNSIQEFI